MIPAVVSDPKTGAIYTHCIFFRSENAGGNLFYLQRSDDDGGETFSDPMRVNDKEGEAGNSGGLRRETAKHALRCSIGCNNIGEGIGAAIGFLLGWDIISTLVLAVGLAFAVGYALTIKSRC
jgi:hypothetical protein